MDLELTAGANRLGCRIGRLDDQREIGDQFETAAEIPRRRDPFQLRMRVAQALFGALQQPGSPVQMQPAFGRPADRDPLQDFRL
jgi:hypothetical protein